MVFEDVKAKRTDNHKTKNSLKEKVRRRSDTARESFPKKNCSNSHSTNQTPRSYSFPSIATCVLRRKSSFRELFLTKGTGRSSFRLPPRNKKDSSNSPTFNKASSELSFWESDDDSPPELIPLSILDEEDDRDYFIFSPDSDPEVLESGPCQLQAKPSPPASAVVARKKTIGRQIGRSNTIACMDLTMKNPRRNTTSCSVPIKSSVTKDTSTTRYLSSSFENDSRRRNNGENSPSINKAKLTQLLKNTQLEQLSKLQTKHQQECDLLDDIRNFGKQRSQLDRDYGLALQKLVQQYNKKDFPNAHENEGNHTTVISVWKSVLEATDKSAQARITSSENYKNGIYEAAKNFRCQKDTNLKKCQDLLNTLQNEISETVKDLTKAKKKYFELEQMAAGAREKYREIEERRKKNQPGIFQSKSGLERTSQKLEQKCDECNKASTIARNEYILSLAAANSHQRRYYEVEMPECMRILDGDVYTKLQDYLSATSRYELEACATTQKAYIVSLQRSTMISREFSTRCFLKDNPTFEWGPKYEFEPCEDDKNEGELIIEQGADGDDNSLNREARKWAGRFVRENKQLQRLARLRQNLENIRNKYAENPELTNESNAADTESRLEKCIEDTRRIETTRLKSESKLDTLRQADVDVDTWIQSAINQAAKEPSNSVPSTPLDPNKKFGQSIENTDSGMTPNGRSIGGDESSFFDDEFDDTFDEAFEDDPSNPDDDVSLTPSDQSRTYPVSCKVIYAYTATRSDELTITPGHVVDVVEDGDLEQWVKARDHDGRVGYVPENYLEFPPPSTTNTLSLHNSGTVAIDKSPSILSTNSNRGNFYGAVSNLADSCTLSSVSGNSTTSGTSSMTTSSHGSVMNHEEHEDSSGPAIYAKAVYEYEGCTNDELTFPEGAIIRILDKDENGVDDGWWKGELNGLIGVFPALVVEELNTEDYNQNNNTTTLHMKTNAWMSTNHVSRIAPPPPQRPRSITRVT